MDGGSSFPGSELPHRIHQKSPGIKGKSDQKKKTFDPGRQGRMGAEGIPSLGFLVHTDVPEIGPCHIQNVLYSYFTNIWIGVGIYSSCQMSACPKELNSSSLACPAPVCILHRVHL